MLLANIRVEGLEYLLQREAVGGVQRDLGPAGRPARFLAHHRATPPLPGPSSNHSTYKYTKYHCTGGNCQFFTLKYNGGTIFLPKIITKSVYCQLHPETSLSMLCEVGGVIFVRCFRESACAGPRRAPQSHALVSAARAELATSE